MGEAPKVHGGTNCKENLFSSPKTCLCFTKEQVGLTESLALGKLNGNKQNRDDYMYTRKVLTSIKVQGVLNSHHLTWSDKENPGKKKSLATYNFCRRNLHSYAFFILLYTHSNVFTENTY